MKIKIIVNQNEKSYAYLPSENTFQYISRCYNKSLQSYYNKSISFNLINYYQFRKLGIEIYTKNFIVPITILNIISLS